MLVTVSTLKGTAKSYQRLTDPRCDLPSSPMLSSWDMLSNLRAGVGNDDTSKPSSKPLKSGAMVRRGRARLVNGCETSG